MFLKTWGFLPLMFMGKNNDETFKRAVTNDSIEGCFYVS